jgi:aspartate carbamoyltransferase catalytic subunit
MSDAYFPTTREYSRNFGLNAQRLKTMQKHALVLHSGPMNRGMEITAEVADSTNSVVIEQVANGVSVRMAVLYLLLGGSNSETGENN